MLPLNVRDQGSTNTLLTTSTVHLHLTPASKTYYLSIILDNSSTILWKERHKTSYNGKYDNQNAMLWDALNQHEVFSASHVLPYADS
jgi:hypothetical protein